MKCHKCKNENITKANFCQKCGEKFTEKEKEIAYDKTIYGKIDKMKKIKDIATLDIITGNIVFKIVSLLVVLGIGLYFLFTMGINTKILNSKEYKIFYNKTLDEYYLIVDDDKESVVANFYRPNRVKEMNAYHYNLDNEELEKKTIDKENTISLNTSENDYYLIESEYSNKKKDNLKVFVYHKSNIPSNN